MKKVFLAAAALTCALAFTFTAAAQENETPEYGYKQTGFASTPKFGGYIIGGYKYSDQEGAHGGPGFNCRLIRLYVDGSIFNDFKYRIQLQMNGRAFTFENPMNPWDVGVGDYSFLVQKMAGMGDRLGEANMGGRDQGLQIQGDLFPLADDSYRLLHYQLGVYNGQGINLADANKAKDIIGTVQVQPIKGLKLGVFGWKGNWVNASKEVLKRERISTGLFYDVDNWTLRAEWATAIAGEKEQSGAADALYVTAGIPIQPWFKLYLKWDEFRAAGTADTSHDMYSACANFRLHKNLNFQLEYRRHNNKLLATPGFNELWFMTYVRF